MEETQALVEESKRPDVDKAHIRLEAQKLLERSRDRQKELAKATIVASRGTAGGSVALPSRYLSRQESAERLARLKQSVVITNREIASLLGVSPLAVRAWANPERQSSYLMRIEQWDRLIDAVAYHCQILPVEVLHEVGF